MFSELAEYIDNDFVAEDEDKELIKVNTRMTKAKFYDPGEFMNACFNYISNKLRNSDFLTDTTNNLQVIKAYNVIYLDGDWQFPRELNSKLYDKYSTSLMLLYEEEWENELQLNNFTDYYTFQFIPNTYPNRKGGFHVFIYVSENVSIEQRLDMYNNIKRKIIDGGKLKQIDVMFQFESNDDPELVLESNTFYQKLFDPSPLKSCQCLLPFAQKDSTSRRYKMFDTSFNFDDTPDYFVIPTQHKEYTQIDQSEITTNETKVYDDNNEFLDEMLNKLKQNSKANFRELGRVGEITAHFMESLRYLSPNHIFWTRLADHDTKLKEITRDLIGFILINYFIEKGGKRPKNEHGEFFEAIARILHPLLKMTTLNLNDPTTERDKFSSLFKNIKDYYTRYTDLNNEYGLFNDTNVSFWRVYITLSPRKKHELEQDDRETLARIKHFFIKYYGNWFRFLTETLLDGMTDEIRPFKQVDVLTEDPRDNITFDDVMKEQPSVNNKARLEDSFYIQTLRKWCRMFIIEGIYDTKSIQETIRSILSAFCRFYIWYSKSVSGNARIFIYNIRQTKSLCQYPYNQWLRDNKDGDLLKDWIKTIYLTIIKPELKTVNLPVGIKPILENLKTAELVDGPSWERMIKPLTNFDKDMETAYKNIISSFAQERFDPPNELDSNSSCWFPMRNGLLKFNDDGTTQMSYYNHEHFMNVYSNIIYDENYNYDSEEYKTVQKMWEQIFPIKEERDYNLSVFSSALNGSILKDQLLIQHGIGADGKTISNNAILGMLGSDGFQSFSRLEENGKANYVLNPSGMGTTMKTETLLTSNKNSHDEGGSIMLKDKRFCTVQEPDARVSNNKLNSSRVKELLSGTTITARAIYQCAESFQPNAILTFQTNRLPNYDEYTEAMKRRITVVEYRSNFLNAAQGDRYKRAKYIFPQDSELGKKLTGNPLYWQAVFYSLLPYAIDLSKKGIKALSNIPRPKHILKETEESFTKSNNIVGWLHKNVKQQYGKILNVYDLKNRIEMAHRDALRDPSIPPVLDLPPKTPALVVNNEILSQIGAAYQGCIHRLKKRWYHKAKEHDKDNRVPRVGTDEILKDEEFQDIEDDLDLEDAIVNKYFEPFNSKLLDESMNNERKDMFLIGFTFADADLDEDDDDHDEPEDDESVEQNINNERNITNDNVSVESVEQNITNERNITNDNVSVEQKQETTNINQSEKTKIKVVRLTKTKTSEKEHISEASEFIDNV